MSGNVVDRFLRPPSAGPKAETKELGFGAEAGRSPRMIDFVLKNGDRKALPYAYLVRADLTGGEALEVTFTECVVRIRGRNLGPLYQHVIAQSAQRVEESGTGFDDDRQQSWVEAIAVEPRK